MQGRQHQVAGLRRLDRNVRRLQVPDFTHHDDVRILPQKRLQRRCKGQPRLFIHVHLVDTRQVDFGGVFRRGNVHPRLVQHIQAGVQRHRFAGTRRPRDQNHPVRPSNRLEQAFFFLGLVAQRINAQLGTARVQDTDHNLFAKQRRQCADPEVNHPVRAHLELHTAVLWDPLLRNIHPRDHFDPRGQLVFDRNRWAGYFAQFPVNTEAHPVLVLIGLKVQVRGPHAERVHQHFVQETHHRCIFDIRGRRLGGLNRGLGSGFIKLEVAANDLFHRLGRRDRIGVHNLGELVVLGNDPVKAHLGRKLDALRSLLV